MKFMLFYVSGNGLAVVMLFTDAVALETELEVNKVMESMPRMT